MLDNKIEIMRKCAIDYSIANNKIEVKLNKHMVYYSSIKSLQIFKESERIANELRTSFKNGLYIALYNNLFS